MNDWQVVIPCIGPASLLERCLLSMHKHQCPDVSVLVVDNTPDSNLDSLAVANLPGVEVERFPHNLGIAASWNRGLARGARWTLLLSASMEFISGLAPLVELMSSEADEYGLRFSVHSFHAHVVGRACVNRIGTFDEGFWPCEYEDADYRRRMDLAGIGFEQRSWPDLSSRGLLCAGNSIAARMGLVPKSDAPAQRYLAKWGGYAPDESFDVAFAGVAT